MDMLEWFADIHLCIVDMIYCYEFVYIKQCECLFYYVLVCIYAIGDTLSEVFFFFLVRYF